MWCRTQWLHWTKERGVMLFSSPALCRITSRLVRPRPPCSPPFPNCVSYIRVPLSSILTAERRSIASPSSPSPSPVSDNGAKLRQRAFLIPVFKKTINSFREMQIRLLGIGLWDNLFFSHVFNKQFPVILKLLSLIRWSVRQLWLCSSPLFMLNVFISLLYIWLCSLPVLADADTMCDTWRSTTPHGQEAWSPNVFGLVTYLDRLLAESVKTCSMCTPHRALISKQKLKNFLTELNSR